MNPQEMAMPAEMAAQGPSPEEMVIYDQMRQGISPQEFSNEMLAGASQVDPQAVAEFTQELQGLDMPPEVLDALSDVVDEILASPERYDELRAQYMEQGLPEDILPEQFDPQFFAALNMAIDQMIAAPTGVQAFAQGGIAELKPIAKAIASYGRNGDTMLAHITPAEARMLRRRGGSGTINPDTGLPEFFLKKLFKGVGKALKSIGNAVKKFANSTVGRIVTTVALGFFLGPAAASMLGVSSAAGVAAVSGFVGGAGSTLLGGGNLKDALKAGAIGGLTAGAGAGIMGGSGAFASGSYTGPTTIAGQVDSFKGMLPGSAPVVDAPPPVPGLNQSGMAPVPPTAPGAQFGIGDPGAGFEFPGYDPTNMAATNPADFGATTPGGGAKPSLFEQGKDFYNKNISPSGIRAAGQEQAMAKTLAQFPGATAEQVMSAPVNSVLGKAYQSAMPGTLATYGPMAAVGIGAIGALGGFKAKPVQTGPITQSLMKPVTQRIAEEGTQRQMYMQGLAGVQYDQYGAPIFGEYNRLPTYDVPDYNSGGVGLPSLYSPMPRQFAHGGDVQHFEEGGNVLGPAAPPPAQFLPIFPETMQQDFLRKMAVYQADQAKLKADQKAVRDRVAQEKALRRAAGSGAMYANINAGLAALAPERNPVNPTETSFGQQNRMRQMAMLQSAYAPMLQGQRGFLAQQAAKYAKPPATQGIAALAQGGYPRRTGQISGPGTEKSDSIPAMLSDGEFVMTAKAVRGAGKGSRRAGAKQMYKLMHQLEKNAERG
jgi:hypothetical protein